MELIHLMVRKVSTRFISEQVAHQNGTKEIPSSVEWHFLHDGLKLLNQLALATGSVWGKPKPPAQARVYFDTASEKLTEHIVNYQPPRMQHVRQPEQIEGGQNAIELFHVSLVLFFDSSIFPMASGRDDEQMRHADDDSRGNP